MRFMDVKTITELREYLLENRDVKSLFFHESPHSEKGIEFVQVVRCKDCMKYIPCQNLPIGTSKWCDLFDRATCEMNYCAWGERKEDAKEE